MDSFEINKILGALLGTCLVLLAVHIASGAIFAPAVAAKPGYEIAVIEPQQPQGGGGTAPAQVPFDSLLPTASADRGTQVAKQCQACHTFGKGQPNNVGPNLYGVVGRKIASVPGFNYSAALKAKTGNWTFDELNTWLTKPSADIPGTAMTFAGITNEKQRADVVVYLNSNSDSPLPLPQAAENPTPPNPPPPDPPPPDSPAAK